MNMNRRCALLLAIVGLALASTAVILFWPRQSGYPGVRLRIIRRGVEQGNPVVFFQLHEAAGRRLRIENVQRITDGNVENPTGPGFWAMSQCAAIGSENEALREFGVHAPTNCPEWRLRVTINLEPASQLVRVKEMSKTWSNLRLARIPFFTSVFMIRNGFYGTDTQVIESDLITNSVLPESSTNALRRGGI